MSDTGVERKPEAAAAQEAGFTPWIWFVGVSAGRVSTREGGSDMSEIANDWKLWTLAVMMDLVPSDTSSEKLATAGRSVGNH